jgi:hypothetical protein
MCNIRNYFSLSCLTKYETLTTSLSSSDSCSSFSNYKDALNTTFYPSKIGKQYLYAMGGKGTFVVMKTVERYDIERDEW